MLHYKIKITENLDEKKPNSSLNILEEKSFDLILYF